MLMGVRRQTADDSSAILHVLPFSDHCRECNHRAAVGCLSIMKQLDEFAVLGGPPVFATPLMVGRPSMPDRASLHRRVDEILDSGRFTNNGLLLQQFEEKLKTVTNCRHAVCVCNGTMALQLLAKASGLTGEVIVPSMTFIATAHALEWIGLKPVFADVDVDSHTLDPASVERCVTANTSAILGVHLWGNPCDVEGLQRIADRHNLKLLFDASHAFGCVRKGVPIGGLCDAETFSFHATKAVHAIEGGAVVTNSDDIAERCRLMRNFGITGMTQIESPGINAKMSELSAAVGLTSLESFDRVMAQNQLRLNDYRTVIKDVPGIDVAIPESIDRRNGQYVVVTVNAARFGMSRDQLLEILRAEGVFARSYFSPGCHNAVPYAGQSIHTPVRLSVTEQLLAEVLQLPTGSAVAEDDVVAIGRLLLAAHRFSSRLSGLLNTNEQHRHQLDPLQDVSSSISDAA